MEGQIVVVNGKQYRIKLEELELDNGVAKQQPNKDEEIDNTTKNQTLNNLKIKPDNIKINTEKHQKYKEPKSNIISITEEEDEQVVKKQKQNNIVSKPKKVKASKLPLCYDRNIKFLEEVEDLIDTEELHNVVDFTNALDYGKYRNDDVSKEEFGYFNKLVNTFNDISDDILKIDDGKITKRQVKRPASKIKTLRIVFDKIKDFLN